MNLDRYEFSSGDRFYTYGFTSEGPKGNVQKLIQFSRVEENFFNLAFGDKNVVDNKIDDLVVTNNGDSVKVLATVVAAVYAFSNLNPGAWVYASGSTESRTRLYRMGISKYFEMVNLDFEIFGLTPAGWNAYEKGYEYQAFLVRRKTLNLVHETSY